MAPIDHSFYGIYPDELDGPLDAPQHAPPPALLAPATSAMGRFAELGGGTPQQMQQLEGDGMVRGVIGMGLNGEALPLPLLTRPSEGAAPPHRLLELPAGFSDRFAKDKAGKKSMARRKAKNVLLAEVGGPADMRWEVRRLPVGSCSLHTSAPSPTPCCLHMHPPTPTPSPHPPRPPTALPLCSSPRRTVSCAASFDSARAPRARRRARARRCCVWSGVGSRSRWGHIPHG